MTLLYDYPHQRNPHWFRDTDPRPLQRVLGGPSYGLPIHITPYLRSKDVSKQQGNQEPGTQVQLELADLDFLIGDNTNSSVHDWANYH